MPAYEATAEGQFNIDEALNTKGFADFLDKFGDDLEPDEANAKEIEKRFRAFENVAIAAKEVKSLFRDEILSESGVKLDDAELACIDAHLMDLAVTYPDSLDFYLNSVEEYHESKERCSQMKIEMEKLGGIPEIQKELNLMNKVSSMGFLQRRFGLKIKSEDEKRMRDYVADRYGVSKKTIKERADSMADAAVDYRDAEKEFGKMKRIFFENFAPADAISDMARQKAQQKLRELADPTKDLKDLDKAQQMFDKFSDDEASLSIDYLHGLDQSQYQATIDGIIEYKIVAQIRDAIAATDVAGSGALSKLERALSEYIERQTVGSKKASDAKDFISNTLSSFMVRETGAKKVLLKRLIVKLA
jgi:hypothetical protein